MTLLLEKSERSEYFTNEDIAATENIVSKEKSFLKDIVSLVDKLFRSVCYSKRVSAGYPVRGDRMASLRKKRDERQRARELSGRPKLTRAELEAKLEQACLVDMADPEYLEAIVAWEGAVGDGIIKSS